MWSVLGKMKILETAAAGLKKFRRCLKKPGVTLKLTLMILGSQSFILHQKLRFMINGWKLAFASSVSQEKAIRGNTRAPMR